MQIVSQLSKSSDIDIIITSFVKLPLGEENLLGFSQVFDAVENQHGFPLETPFLRLSSAWS